MATWIKLEEAATRYNIRTSILKSWIETWGIKTFHAPGGTVLIDEMGVIICLYHYEVKASSEYIQELKEKCEAKDLLCNHYLDLISIQTKEIQLLNEKNAKLNELHSLAKKQKVAIGNCLDKFKCLFSFIHSSPKISSTNVERFSLL